jgi:hypothetical protein
MSCFYVDWLLAGIYVDWLLAGSGLIPPDDEQ